MDLNAFREAVAKMSADERRELREALSKEAEDEPTHLQRQVGVPLADRMRTPMTALRRQIRLERLRILDEAP